MNLSTLHFCLKWLTLHSHPHKKSDITKSKAFSPWLCVVSHFLVSMWVGPLLTSQGLFPLICFLRVQPIVNNCFSHYPCIIKLLPFLLIRSRFFNGSILKQLYLVGLDCILLRLAESASDNAIYK